MAQLYLIAVDTDAELGAVAFAKAPRGLRAAVVNLSLDRLYAQVTASDRDQRRAALAELFETVVKEFRLLKGMDE